MKVKATIEKCVPPSNSQIAAQASSAYFSDAYRFKSKDPSRQPLEVWMDHMATTPNWVNKLMFIRNKLVPTLGLKDLGPLNDINQNKNLGDYCVGDKIGIFTLTFINQNEIILTDSDQHLDVSVSVFKASNHSDEITISTMVNTHNTLGKVYMLFVKPIHQIIVPATIKKAEFS